MEMGTCLEQSSSILLLSTILLPGVLLKEDFTAIKILKIGISHKS